MKNILSLFIAVLLFARCEDALQEEPQDFLARANFYQTASDAESALLATYGAFYDNGFFYNIWYMALVEGSADYVNSRGSQFPISEYQGLDQQNQVRAFNTYNAIYAGINRANVVIENIADIEMNEDDKQQIIAEAYFLRAFFYTTLANHWGGVPLRLSETRGLDDLAAPRASVEEVYSTAINDLETALPNLATSFPPDQSGRATTWAAKMLLADIYLTTQRWQEARDLANDVIENGGFDLVPVTQPEDFLQIYGPDVVTHTEDIFSLHYSETNTNSLVNWQQRPGQFGVYGPGGVWAWLPNTNSFIGSWDDADIRKEYNLYTSIVVDGDTIPLPDVSPILFRKYRDPQSNQGSRNNIPVYRLAEAYLIYAEAANEAEGAPSALALERLNKVKRRAYGYAPGSPSPVDFFSGLDQANFRDTVLLERGFELLLEAKRWHDLKRTGRAKEVINATGKDFQDVSLLFPLPLDEINNNPAIGPEDQNPGY